jgi:hypothetical protein
MQQHLVIKIPHRLGQAEAVSRLKTGLSGAQAKFGQLFSSQKVEWTGSRLQFELSVLAQSVTGSIDVFDDFVRLELELPWLLAKIAERLQPLIRKEATLLLEKK